jgi:hypothetical protein
MHHCDGGWGKRGNPFLKKIYLYKFETFILEQGNTLLIKPGIAYTTNTRE